MMVNFQILLLLIVIFIIPLILIGYRFHSSNKKIDEKYERKLREIEKHYGVKL